MRRIFFFSFQPEHWWGHVPWSPRKSTPLHTDICKVGSCVEEEVEEVGGVCVGGGWGGGVGGLWGEQAECTALCHHLPPLLHAARL